MGFLRPNFTKMEHSQQTVLIAAATGGSGYELAKLFARDRFRVVIVGKESATLNNVGEVLKTLGAKQVVKINKDLSKEQAADEIYVETRALGLRIVLVRHEAAIDDDRLSAGAPCRAEHEKPGALHVVAQQRSAGVDPCVRSLAELHIQADAIAIRAAEIVVAPGVLRFGPRIDGALVERQTAIGDDQVQVVIDGVAEALAAAAGPERRVEREQARLRRDEFFAAALASELLVETQDLVASGILK